VADDLRADLDVFLLPGIAENERVAGFIPNGHADDPRGDRARPQLANIVTWFWSMILNGHAPKNRRELVACRIP
jgi:hypothetical protein